MLASAAFAADVHLGPERPLSPALEIGPAAFHQESPSVASNGRDFLAVWIDRRSAGFEAPLFASRLGTDGRPVEPLGQKLADGASYPHVASAGEDYLIAWHDAAGSKVVRVDENGRPLGDVRLLNTIREPREIVSNGSTYLLFEAARNRGGTPPLTATILDRDGAPLQTLDASYGRLIWAGAYDGRYVVIAVATRCDPGCQEVPTLHTIAEASGGWSETARMFLPYIVHPSAHLAAVASRDRILVTSYTHAPGSAGAYAVFDYNGAVVRGALPLPGEVVASGAAWDGREFMLLFSSSQKTFAQRLGRDGETLAEPFVLHSVRTMLPDLASNGSAQLLLWLDYAWANFNDVVSRVVDDFATLQAAGEQQTLVSYSGAAQFDVRVASADAGLFAAWKDSNGGLEGALNGTAISIAPAGSHTISAPSVAAGAKNFLVAWYDGDYQGWDLLAKRIGFDGRVLDAEPLLLASSSTTAQVDNPGIAYDGSSFLVVLAVRSLYYARVTDDGEVLDRRTVQSSDASARWPDPVWTGHAFLVPYAFIEHLWGCDICPPKWSIALDGEVVFQNAGMGEAMKVTAAIGRNRVTLAWPWFDGRTKSIYVAQISPQGNVLRAPFRLRDVPNYTSDSLSLEWNGSEYVLAWNETSGTIHAMRLTHLATAIDADPFAVAQTHSAFSRFSMTPTATGVAFGYDRIDPASGHVTRAFTRSLDRLTSGPRRRAVRR